MCFQDPSAKISRNAISVESERLSKVCAMQPSCGASDRPAIDDRTLALIVIVGLVQTALNEGRITKDQFDKIMNELAEKFKL